MRHINLIGVELEGGWNKRNVQRDCSQCDPCSGCQDNDRLECGVDYDYTQCGRCGYDNCEDRELLEGFKYDSSVSGLSTNFYGECVSSPISRLDRLGTWIIDHYPQETNESCGYHIHISLKRMFDYSRLMSSNFYEYFLQELEQWGKDVKLSRNHGFWDRLNGHNQYCKKEHHPDRQVARGACRYTQLNYCWHEHGTIECRVFPMFKQPKITVLAMYRLCEIVESWLSAQPRERSIITTVQAQDVEVPGENTVILPTVDALAPIGRPLAWLDIVPNQPTTLEPQTYAMTPTWNLEESLP